MGVLRFLFYRLSFNLFYSFDACVGPLSTFRS